MSAWQNAIDDAPVPPAEIRELDRRLAASLAHKVTNRG